MTIINICQICQRRHSSKCYQVSLNDIIHYETFDNYYRRSIDKIKYNAKDIVFFVKSEDFYEDGNNIYFNYQDKISKYSKFKRELYLNLYPIGKVIYYLVDKDGDWMKIDGIYLENVLPNKHIDDSSNKKDTDLRNIFTAKWISLINNIIKIQKFYRKSKFVRNNNNVMLSN